MKIVKFIIIKVCLMQDVIYIISYVDNNKFK